MKNLLFALLLFSVGCSKTDCGTGYGPTDCAATWASHYTGNWISENGVLMSVQPLSNTRIRIDGNYAADLISWDRLTVSYQSYLHPITGNDIIVNGGGRLEGETLIMEMTHSVDGQATNSIEHFTRN